MKDSKRSICLWIGITFVYLMLCHIFVISSFKSSIYLNYIEMLIWFILMVIILISNGFPKDNSYLKKIGIKYAIIYCFLYALIAYGLGIFTGFSRSIYSHTIKSLCNNIFPVLIMVISREIIRYIICKKSNDKVKPLVFITITYILYDLILSLYYYNLNSSEQIFLFICLELFGISAKNALYTYLTYNISLVPTLLIALAMEIVWYIVPIMPSLGNYISSVLGILMPYYLYLKTNKILKYNEKQDIVKNKNRILIFPLLGMIAIIFFLVSGIGKYHMIAIASNSMNPIYYKGDAVIYEKMTASDIKKDDILVFESDGKIITHRVVSIIKVGNRYYFRTKGDNNDNVDSQLVDDTFVYGKVRYIVKYIGIPTVKLQEIFKQE